MVFAVPGIVLSTDWCVQESNIGAKANANQFSCEHACEMVLSLRTLMTVLVYFRTSANRDQLFDWQTLLAKIYYRMLAQCCNIQSKNSRSAGVRISTKEDSIRMIEREPAEHDISYAAAATTGHTQSML